MEDSIGWALNHQSLYDEGQIIDRKCAADLRDAPVNMRLDSHIKDSYIEGERWNA